MAKFQLFDLRYIALAVITSVSGCSSPPARSVDYLTANPDMMKSVLEACSQSAGISSECENARAAAEKLRADRTFDRAMETSKPARGAKPTF